MNKSSLNWYDVISKTQGKVKNDQRTRVSINLFLNLLSQTVTLQEDISPGFSVFFSNYI